MVVGKVVLKHKVGSFVRVSESLESVKSFRWWFSGVILKSHAGSILPYFSLEKISALVTSEMNVFDLKDGVLCKPKIIHFLFVIASPRGSISISVGKLYLLTILQFKSWFT